MNREEKNQLTRRRILDSALAEFSEQGYGASSINTISSANGLSKGIIYHYYPTKDDLYLACVEECFNLLASYLKDHTGSESGTAEEQLEHYFNVRLDFFMHFPVYQRIFCDAVITPPLLLKDAVCKRKSCFDQMNADILNRLLEPLALRADISRQEVVDTFRQYQDFINARFQMASAEEIDIREHEKACRRALSILLYGVIDRREEDR